jgi:acetylornithine deacetylase/succinyl-diaminopimelate desuccinylase-like protein
MTCSLRFRTANRDAHSSTAAVNPSAAWRLIWALSTLKDRDDRVLIPGFYDDVLEPTEAEVDLLRQLPAEEERTLRTMEMRDFIGGVRGLDYQKRLAFSPTCTINGMGSGYQGRGTKTIVPAESFAKLDFRLVPNQDPQDILRKLKQHLLDQGFDDVAVNAGDGEYPARTDPADPFIDVVRSTGREIYGQDPLVLPSGGGTQPLHPISHTLGVPIASAGIGSADGRAHAPDENISLQEFVRGTRHIAAIIERLGEQASR